MIFLFFKKIYRVVVYSFFNALLLLCVLNILSYFFFYFSKQNNEEELLKTLIAYNAYTSDDYKISVDSTYVIKFIDNYVSFLKSNNSEFQYHPVIEYQHNSVSFDGYNISRENDDYSYRFTGDDLCGDDKVSIFCLGGSTTLGILVEDYHTWPAFLYEILSDSNYSEKYCVKNYGTASFSMTQETNQFIDMLKRGHRPSLVIFLDGINVGPKFDGSEFSGRIHQRFNFDGYHFSDILVVLSKMPLIKLIKGEPYFFNIDFQKTDDYDMAEIEFTDEYNNMIVNRFVQNAIIRKRIADLYGVKVIQFLQPNSFVNYNINFLSDIGKQYFEGYEGKNLRKNFKYIYNSINNSEAEYIDLSYLFQNYNKPAIVDFIHYSPDFNRQIALEIYSYIKKIDLPDYRFDDNLSTGTTFQPGYLNQD